MASSPNIRSLTSLRGFAAWWVVLFHFRGILLSWSSPEALHVFGCGYVAVDLFFVLSGFVIALNYGALFQNKGLAETPYFLTVRLARIYPLHLFILCVMVITPVGLLLTGHANLPARYDPGYFFLSLGLVQNWGFTNRIAWNDPAWSIRYRVARIYTVSAVCLAVCSDKSITGKADRRHSCIALGFGSRG